MARHRVSRLNEQLRREITDIIRQQLRDPRIGAVTVTDVRVTTDLDFARVFITTLDEHARTAETLAGLKAAASYVRGELGRRLSIRHIPELRFQLDESLEHARRIEHLLAEVRAAEQAREPTQDHDGDGQEDDTGDGSNS